MIGDGGQRHKSVAAASLVQCVDQMVRAKPELIIYFLEETRNFKGQPST